MSGLINSAIKRAAALPAALAVLLAACSGPADFHPSVVNIKTYKDIRGVTAEEAAAVEAMASARDTFVYGHILEKESFRLPGEAFSGFTVELFEFIGGLLGITFVPRYFEELNSLTESLGNGEIDIACGVVGEPERSLVTAPIAGRRMNVYARADAASAKNMAGLGGHKVGFLKNTGTLDVLHRHYSGLPFEPVEAEGFSEAAKMIESGGIDFFIVDRDVTQFFERYANIRRQKFSSLVYTPITLVAVNDKLAPAISIFNKYLRAGGTAKVFELYEKGETEYRKQLLYSAVTSEERAYIDSVKVSGGVVPVGFQHDAYPSCFYNHIEKKYQGIAPDILTEVAKLTGLRFEETATTNQSSLADMLQKLRDGELSIVTQMLYSKSREEDFIWSASPYLSTRYALISRLDFPKVDNYRVYYHRIGLVDKSVHAEMFDLWFPNHGYKTFYATGNELFDALEKGDLCLAMVSENMLWAMTNFREKTGYKVNVSFDYMQEARFGYNKKDVVLRNI
ncbi:MAG: transporter substrate-binding domain-containing protein, partial [Chitinispirillales bacterium]|nr:transporter substrate-binding domain-containing protein [Chitinispirillales bacterium]